MSKIKAQTDRLKMLLVRDYKAGKSISSIALASRIPFTSLWRLIHGQGGASVGTFIKLERFYNNEVGADE
jgi:hypothetical protein